MISLIWMYDRQLYHYTNYTKYLLAHIYYYINIEICSVYSVQHKKKKGKNIYLRFMIGNDDVYLAFLDTLQHTYCYINIQHSGNQGNQNKR